MPRASQIELVGKDRCEASIFIGNPTMLMEQGALGLADLLNTRKIEQTDIDQAADENGSPSS